MINTKEFTNRLQKVIDYYGESASSFAEKIGVQRSSISHILSGRNKPSLEFVLKILTPFPEVELYWLLFGKGNFPAFNKPEAIKETKQILVTENEIKADKNIETEKSIERIVIFYSDGSFKNFEN